MRVLDDLIISKIKKVTLSTLNDEETEQRKLWATKDKEGNWVLACKAFIAAWPSNAIATDTSKLDNLLKEGFDCPHAELFEDKEWSTVLLPDVSKIVRATETTFQSEAEKKAVTYEAVPFEYSVGWSKTTAQQRAYYRTEYLELLELITDQPTKYRIYTAGPNSRGQDQAWLIVYEGKQPIMIIANVVPTLESVFPEDVA